MRVPWIISISISTGLFTSCPVQPSLSEDCTGDKMETLLIVKDLEDEQPNLFLQDRNKPYSQIDRPWVLAKPLFEFNKSNSFLLNDE